MRWRGLALIMLGGWGLALAQDPPSAGLHVRYVAGTGLLVNASGVVTQWWDVAGSGRHLDRRGGSPRSLAVTANGTNREVLRLGGYHREFFVSQTPELAGMADAVIDLEALRVDADAVPME